MMARGREAREAVSPSMFWNGSGQGVTDPDGVELGRTAGNPLCKPATILKAFFSARPEGVRPRRIPSGFTTAASTSAIVSASICVALRHGVGSATVPLLMDRRLGWP